MKVKLFFIIFLMSLGLSATTNSDSTLIKKIKKIEKNVKLLTIPIVYYTPETKWGAGAAGVFRFKLKGEPDSARHSNVLFSLSVTQLKQIVLGAPFQFWLKKEKYNIYGEPGYQNVNFLFYGIGNNSLPTYKEKYYTSFTRLRLAALRKIYPHFYAGFRYVFDYTTMYRLESAGQLINGSIAGSSGGVVSGMGGTIKYDNRDNQFYPTKGYYVELYALTNSKVTGSNYRFDKYSLDMSAAVPLPFKEVLVFNAYGVITTGNVPFYHLAMLGGEKKMRGIYEGRYRDKDCWVLQAEYRKELFWRIGMVAFAAVGNVAPSVKDFSLKYTHFTYGGGIRGTIDKKQHLNLRLDLGVSDQHINYYFTIGEAF
ncbi:MAG: BamA/TamA family outer membrane protein [Bacteroidia bacterium]